MKPVNFLKLGQGPRPDLLEEELRQEEKRKAGQKEQQNRSEPAEKSAGKGTGENRPDFEGKDILAMIIAMFQLILPWIAIGILAYFLLMFLITRI
ncbi:hypothetical protein A7X67_01590 [Clostridium sp. W14A]|nr:hypothetical protein A7X67_01590 [Clostridium sp. W14A]